MSFLSCLGCHLACSGKRVAFICRGAVVFFAAMSLLGCVDEDRVLTARCVTASDALAIATFAPSDASQEMIGALNARPDVLGTLFQVAPDQDRAGGVRWMPAHTVVTQAVNTSHEFYWNSRSIRMRVDTDLDGEELPESSRAGIESTLLSGSGVVAWDVERRAIANVLQAINQDPEALSILQRAAPEDRHIVVSSRLLARFVGVFYTPGGGMWLSDGSGSASIPFITPWTFRVGNTNVHSDYSCGLIDELNSRATATKVRVPVVSFYTAVRYDPLTRTAERDLRISDPDLLTASLQATQ